MFLSRRQGPKQSDKMKTNNDVELVEPSKLKHATIYLLELPRRGDPWRGDSYKYQNVCFPKE